MAALSLMVIVHKKFTLKDWLLRLLLLLGIFFATLHPSNGPSQDKKIKMSFLQKHVNYMVSNLSSCPNYAGQMSEDSEPKLQQQDYIVGLTAVVLSAITAGFGGVFFDYLEKNHHEDKPFWVRNIELSFYAMTSATLIMLITSIHGLLKYGFFIGYNWVVWFIVAQISIGSLLLSMTLFHVNAALRAISPTASMFLVTIASMFLFEFRLSPQFVIGALLAYFAFNAMYLM